MRILGIDFETANQYRDSACSVGIYCKDFSTKEIICEKEILLNPKQEFNYFNTLVNGITPEMVVDAPTFEAAYNEIVSLIDDQTVIVAHNASFDISVFMKSCERYSLEIPSFYFLDTLNMSKTLLKGLISYSLDYVADHLNLGSFKDHNALDDARICVHIFEYFLNDLDLNDYKNFAHKIRMRVGSYDNDNNRYRYSSLFKTAHAISIEVDDIDETCFDDNHPFFNKNIVFTGTLNSMSRELASKKVLSVGGNPVTGVNKSTNFLVFGFQDKFFLNGKDKSNKLIKAETLLAKGAEIEIIDEDTFLKML